MKTTVERKAVIATLELILADGKVDEAEVETIWKALGGADEGSVGPDEIKSLAELVEETALAKNAEFDAATLEFIWRGHDATGDGKFNRNELRRALESFAEISGAAGGS